jgi:hypothetical protein
MERRDLAELAALELRLVGTGMEVWLLLDEARFLEDRGGDLEKSYIELESSPELLLELSTVNWEVDSCGVARRTELVASSRILLCCALVGL